MTHTYTARDNVPGCAWQTHGDDLEWLCDAAWDHLIDDHPTDAQGLEVTYTHVACGERRDDVMGMRWHIYMHSIGWGVVAEAAR